MSMMTILILKFKLFIIPNCYIDIDVHDDAHDVLVDDHAHIHVSSVDVDVKIYIVESML